MFGTCCALFTTCVISIGLSVALQRSGIDLFQHKSSYHPGPVYKIYSGTDSLRCMKHCMMDLACVSFNFNRTSDQCSLLGEIWEEGELESDHDMDFYGKVIMGTMCRDYM